MKLLKLLFTTGCSLMLTAMTAFGADVKGLTAGNLKHVAADIDKNITSLKLSGTMNASDFSYIQDNFNELQELDLDGVKIDSYVGERLPYTGLSTSPASTLPAYSLTGLASLSSVTLPADLKAIGKGALSGTGITSISLPAGLESIGEYAFLRCNNLKSINIPAKVRTIGQRAFAYCKNLTSVSIDDNTSLPSISEGMFEASGLKSLSLKALANCTEIGPWALAECNGLLTLVLPSKTQNIETAALMGTKSIQTLSLPESTDYIADNAMANMHGLQTIIATAVTDVPYLGENVWRNVTQKNVTLVAPDDLVDYFRDADQWQDFNIIAASQSSIDEVSGMTKDNRLKVSRNGNMLKVTTDNPIGRISIYNVKGHLVQAANTPHAKATFNTSSWQTGVYLIVCEAGVAKISI